MAMIYLITSEEIRLNTPMGGNVDSDKFIHFINDVQVMVLENVLGTRLYEKILSDYDDNSITGVYKTMLDGYIKPVLWHSVFAEYIKIGSVIVGNGGVYKHIAQDAQVAELDDINYVAKNAQSKADTYIDRLTRFLCDRKNDIPEYTQTQDEGYDIKPNHPIQLVSGWYLPNNKCC